MINEIIHNRKSVYPKNYIDKEISELVIKQVLENACRAPTHKLTEPWRFKVIRGNQRAELSNFLADKYKKLFSGENFSESKYKSLQQKPLLANCIIAINMQRDPAERIPEWEEIASVAMAVQNMYLTCTAYNIGCYWSTPKLKDCMNDFCEMAEGEKCLGLFYMGYYEKEIPSIKRAPLKDKSNWL
ncbi:MAG: nitroreductase [Bacteroidia bacterium]|nr:nitroreductase [Bacteroidia bacterium]NNC85510.1 nitroreductase [Bacteroidia bacterium]NNM15882.1 nitroreductase [Bacteroidia bacterium]